MRHQRLLAPVNVYPGQIPPPTTATRDRVRRGFRSLVATAVSALSVASLLGFFAVGLYTPLSAQETNESTDGVAGHWEGKIETPTGDLVVKVDLEEGDGGAWSGTIDLPQQGASGLALEKISVDGASVAFTITGVPGQPTFDGTLAANDDGPTIAGTFTQGPAKLAFELGRGAAELPRRPQDPVEPVPYRAEDIRFEHDGLAFGGTLTLPAEETGEGPYPGVVLLSGSGAQDRDEALAGHRPFLVLADALTRRGIAVLRIDDRGVGETEGNLTVTTVDDLASDALAAIGVLAAREEVDATRVGLIGHSEGGLIAPLAASRSEAVRFVVMLAGPGVPGTDILARQLSLISKAGGMSEEDLARQEALQRKALGLILSDAPADPVEAAMRDLVEFQVARSPAAAQMTDEAREAMVDASVSSSSSPWFKSFMAYDPRPALAKVTVPVLALNGSLDLQVETAQSFPEIEKALAEAGNQDVILREFEGLNHLFQHATTGAPGEYAQIEETISPEVLQVIGDWILERFGLAP